MQIFEFYLQRFNRFNSTGVWPGLGLSEDKLLKIVTWLISLRTRSQIQTFTPNSRHFFYTTLVFTTFYLVLNLFVCIFCSLYWTVELLGKILLLH